MWIMLIIIGAIFLLYLLVRKPATELSATFYLGWIGAMLIFFITGSWTVGSVMLLILCIVAIGCKIGIRERESFARRSPGPDTAGIERVPYP